MNAIGGQVFGRVSWIFLCKMISVCVRSNRRERAPEIEKQKQVNSCQVESVFVSVGTYIGKRERKREREREREEAFTQERHLRNTDVILLQGLPRA